MPTYDYICADCSHEWAEARMIAERHQVKCPKCKSATHNIVPMGVAQHSFRARVFENLTSDPKGVYIDSKHKLKEFCKSESATAVAEELL